MIGGDLDFISIAAAICRASATGDGGREMKNYLAAALALFLPVLMAMLLLAEPAQAQGDCDRYAKLLADLGRGASVTSDDIAWSMIIERNKTCANVTPENAASVASGQTASAPVQQAVVANGTPGVAKDMSLMSGQAGCTPSARLDLQSSNPCDWFMLALAYQQGNGVREDHRKSLDYLIRAAKAGHATAQLGLGEAYQHGFGGLQASATEAFRWTSLAAQQGHPNGAMALGIFLSQGTGTAVDKAAAARAFQASLDLGHLPAAAELGMLYFEGEGVSRDPARAVRLWEYAAERGDADSQSYLGDAYRMGIGVPFDTARARYWLGHAISGGNKYAVKVLAYMDEVDRRYASMPAPSARSSSSSSSSGPSLSEQAMETHRRQIRENCAAALKGANRLCTLP
jgi:TPR repeat protein